MPDPDPISKCFRQRDLFHGRRDPFTGFREWALFALGQAQVCGDRLTLSKESPNQIQSLRPLRSLCVKIRSEKAVHTEMAKITKERTTTNQRGHQSELVFATLTFDLGPPSGRVVLGGRFPRVETMG